MKGKYITTNIILACLASATAARREASQQEPLPASSKSTDVAVKAADVKMYSKQAA